MGIKQRQASAALAVTWQNLAKAIKMVIFGNVVGLFIGPRWMGHLWRHKVLHTKEKTYNVKIWTKVQLQLLLGLVSHGPAFTSLYWLFAQLEPVQLEIKQCHQWTKLPPRHVGKPILAPENLAALQEKSLLKSTYGVLWIDIFLVFVLKTFCTWKKVHAFQFFATGQAHTDANETKP